MGTFHVERSGGPPQEERSTWNVLPGPLPLYLDLDQQPPAVSVNLARPGRGDGRTWHCQDQNAAAWLDQPATDG